MTALPTLLATSILLVSTGFEGRVVDARTGQPVAGAVVMIAAAGGPVSTRLDGTFTWPGVPELPFEIIIILADGRLARPIRVDALDPGAELRLAIDPAHTEAVTVRGTAPGIDAPPGSSAVSIGRADIELRQPLTLAQVLEVVPGISTISEGQGGTPAIRGLARGRTLILVDGARVHSERGAGPNASFLDPGVLARVDVARGPGSVAYGTDAFGGVVAAHTLGPVFEAGFRGRVAGTLAAGVPERRLQLDLSKGYGHGGVLLGARVREVDDYTSPAGRVAHSSWRDAGVRLRWDHRGAGGLWSAGWQIDHAADIHRPRSDSDVTVATSPFERSHRLTLSFAPEADRGWRSVRVDGFVGASEDRVEQDRLAAPGRTRRLERADTGGRDYQVRVTGRPPGGLLRLHAGADIHGQVGVSSTSTTFAYAATGNLISATVTPSMNSAHRTAVGLFVEGDTPVWRRMRASAGVRGEGTRSVNEGGYFGDHAIGHGDVAATAAVTVAPARRTALTIQASRGFREPTLTDRFARGPVGRGFLEGSPGLAPETSGQLDLKVGYDAGAVAVTGSWYRYGISNLIERYLAAPDLFRMRNRGRARLEGIEIDARLRIRGGLTLDVLGSASRGRDADTGAPLDDVAPRAVSIVGRHAWRNRLWSYARLAAVAEHRAAGPSELPMPGYVLVDGGAVVRVAAQIELHATLRNALDSSYYSSAGPRRVWAPGRQVSATLVVGR